MRVTVADRAVGPGRAGRPLPDGRLGTTTRGTQVEQIRTSAGSGTPIDVGDLRDRLPALIDAIDTAAGPPISSGVGARQRATVPRLLRSITPRLVPTIVESIASGGPLDRADLAVVRECGATLAREGFPLAASLEGLEPATTTLVRFLLGAASGVPVAFRAVLIARAAHVTHRIATEVAAGWFDAHPVDLDPPAPDDLDDVDRQILHMVVDGGSNTSIARALAYSPQTIRWRLSRLMRRWGAPNRAALAAAAVRRGSVVPRSAGRAS